MINVKFEEGINDLTTENLYQWDTYQMLQLSGVDFGVATPKVHFANKKSSVALVVSGVFNDDGSVKVSIPNSLLTEKYDILAYVYTSTGLTGKTIKSITIPIISRLKPSEYTQPTDEDIAKIEEIELEAKVIIDGLTASEYSSTETYKRPNIVYYDLCSYMCKSNNEITGVLPTDTTVWQKLVQGARITGISINEYGNLVFNSSDGSSFTIDFSTINVNTVDSSTMPALDITKDLVSGRLKYDGCIIPRREFIFSGNITIDPSHPGEISGLRENDKIEIEYRWNTAINFFERCYVTGSRVIYINRYDESAYFKIEDGKINYILVNGSDSDFYVKITRIYRIID